MNLLGILITGLILIAVGALLGGWLFMLTVGVVHGEWLPMMPTIGYWSAVKVSFMLSLTAGIAWGFASSRD
jgi:hypothetical protein